MNIEYLHEFIVLSKRLNYHDAAKELNISQSALSKHISALENYYGTPLFVRSKHQIHLTNSGTYLLESALKIWELFENSKQMVDAHFRNEYEISCGGILDNTGDYSIVAHAESLFKEANPKNALHLERCISAAVDVQIESLWSDEVDCIAIYNAPDFIANEESLDYERIYAIPMEITLSKQSPLSVRSEILLDNLNGLRLIQFIGSRFSQLWAQIEYYLQENGIRYSVKPIVISSTYDYIASLQKLEDVAFIAPFRSTPTTALKNPELVTLPINQEDFTLNLDIVFRKEKHSDLLDQFIQALRTSYQKHLSRTVFENSDKTAPE